MSKKVAVLALLLLWQELAKSAVQLDEARVVGWYDFSQEDKRSPFNPTLFERFESALQSRFDKTFNDDFSPLQTALRFDQIGGQALQDRYAELTKRAFRRSVQYSAREALVDAPFVVSLLSWFEGRQEETARFLRGSVADVDEEDIEPLSTENKIAEQSWHRQIERSGGLRYGLKLLHFQRPYAFISGYLGPRRDPLLRYDLRCYLDDYTDPRIESVVTIPIDRFVSVRVGMRYEPNQDDSWRAVFRIDRKVGAGRCFLAFRGQRNNQVLLGYEIPW